ncbi:MAG TPA: hypothetical protein VJG90_03030 [Candidatus Nanoarchaeia archaeon]|nr:hypothetical protein [Candidatus Nanoarchaeia archaeon]
MVTAYFFDTSALTEQVRRNPLYQPYVGATIITTQLNLFDVYYWLVKDFGLDIANRFLENYYPFTKNLNLKTIQKAAQIKRLHPQFSNTNCIGYAVANQLKIPFLTGDSAFHGMDGIEFVK